MLNLITNEARTEIAMAFHITSFNPLVQQQIHTPITYRNKGLRIVKDTDTSSLAAVRDFEKEIIILFRGELRKVNAKLARSEQNSGTACRIAAASLFRELKPQSERGQTVLQEYLLSRPDGLVYAEHELSHA